MEARYRTLSALRSGISVRESEILIERLDGSRGVALVNINVLKDASGKVLGAVNCFQDITERKRSAEQMPLLVGKRSIVSKTFCRRFRQPLTFLAPIQSMV
jgi:signal transduction histidine kinase